MNKKTTGAWIIHHSKKLEGVSLAGQQYEQIEFAGKCGLMLNAVAASNQADLDTRRITALAKANGIKSRLELPDILNELERQRLIDRGQAGITVLGLTTAQTLEHTASIFEETSPTSAEKAALSLSEESSQLPMLKQTASEFVADNFHLSSKDTAEVLSQYEHIGFVDSETISDRKLYFNGNLFRREDIAKIDAILSSLAGPDKTRVTDFAALLQASGCVPKDGAISVLGQVLYSKLSSIGFLDENTIGNEAGSFTFVTRPASFSKFTNSAADDAFDSAKALVTALTYGMTTSPSGRGRITMIEALMNNLISGMWVGPATAIGQDYKVLELRGVIEVRPVGGDRFNMRLLKKDVGQLALKVITEGDASTESLLQLPSVSATKYVGPEHNRVLTRKEQPTTLQKGVSRLLDDLRTGGIR